MAVCSRTDGDEASLDKREGRCDGASRHRRRSLSVKKPPLRALDQEVPMSYKVDSAPPHDLDKVIYATIARMTSGLSPASLFNAHLDWLVHLAFSPGKQHELAVKAGNKARKMLAHMIQSVWRRCETCIDPLPQDTRFAADEWRQMPYLIIYQTFLMQQQWWHNATTDVPGVNHHHERVLDFTSRQLLDVVSPSNFFWTNPEVLQCTLDRGGLNLLEGSRNWWEDVVRWMSDKSAVNTDNFRPGHEVALTPGKVVYRNHLIELIQYSAQTPEVHANPILMVPSWIMKFYILDLSPHNSMVRYLVNRGHTVFMVSWRNPQAKDWDLGMDDYLNNGVMDAIRVVSQIVPKQKIQAVGYCLGGTLLSIAAALMARNDDTRLKSLTLLASQVDFTEPGELALFIDDSQLTFLDGVMSDQGYLDGKQMAGAFTFLNQRDLVFSRLVRDYWLGKRAPVTDLMAWNADATRMPYRQHSHYLHSLYRHNDLAEGRYIVDGRPVVLRDVRLPVFCLGTQRDTVSPWRSVYKLQLFTSTELTFCLTSGGHNVGVVNPPGGSSPRHYQLSRRKQGAKYLDPDTWAQEVALHPGSWWPAWAHWLEGQAGPMRKAPVAGDPATGFTSQGSAPGRYVLEP